MITQKTLNKTKTKIPSLGIGTWKMNVDPQREIEALKTAFANGMRFVDTAEMYGSEGVVGAAIKGEKDIFVATKASPSNFRYNDLIKACNMSLERLHIDQIDLYQLHWPNHSVPISETMRAMEELADQGKIKHIGVSNFSVKELKEAQESMKRHEIVSNQVEYSVLVRDIEQDGILDYCKDNNITIIAYSPLARGAIFEAKYKYSLAKLDEIAKRHDKSVSQVALNWLISKPNVVAIPKASDKKHVLENAGALDLNLSKDEIEEIDGINQRKRSMAYFFGPVLKINGAWAKVAGTMGKRSQKSKTTKSSKK